MTREILCSTSACRLLLHEETPHARLCKVSAGGDTSGTQQAAVQSQASHQTRQHLSWCKQRHVDLAAEM